MGPTDEPHAHQDHRAVDRGHRGVRASATQGAGSSAADGVRCRRDPRHRHLRADRRGRRGEGRARHRAVVRVLRHRLRAGRALLRGVRQYRAGGGLGVHVLLRQPRRARRLDHRLGPDPGAGARGQHGRRGVVELLRRRDEGDRHHHPGLRLRGRPQPGCRGDRADPHRRPLRGNQDLLAGQLRLRGHQGRHRAARDRGRRCSSSR